MACKALRYIETHSRGCLKEVFREVQWTDDNSNGKRSNKQGDNRNENLVVQFGGHTRVDRMDGDLARKGEG